MIGCLFGLEETRGPKTAILDRKQEVRWRLIDDVEESAGVAADLRDSRERAVQIPAERIILAEGSIEFDTLERLELELRPSSGALERKNPVRAQEQAAARPTAQTRDRASPIQLARKLEPPRQRNIPIGGGCPRIHVVAQSVAADSPVLPRVVAARAQARAPAGDLSDPSEPHRVRRHAAAFSGGGDTAVFAARKVAGER